MHSQLSKNPSDINNKHVEKLCTQHAESLKRAFWLSGTPCAGKTTISNAIADQLGWNVYHVDDYWENHCSRAGLEKMPTFHKITRLTGDALWLRPLAEQVESEPKFIQESFLLVLEDIIEILYKDRKNLIIDAPVQPFSAKKAIPNDSHIFYLIPKESFQRSYYAKRDSIQPVLAKTTDPELAFENWMARDASYARWLEHEVDNYNLARICVDGSLTIEATIDLVVKHYSGSKEFELGC